MCCLPRYVGSACAIGVLTMVRSARFCLPMTGQTNVLFCREAAHTGRQESLQIKTPSGYL